jgi:hypothetical protein
MSEAPGSAGGSSAHPSTTSHILHPKVQRRTSLGGFVILEDDDFRNAMGKLMGIIPLTADPIASMDPGSGGGGGGGGAAGGVGGSSGAPLSARGGASASSASASSASSPRSASTMTARSAQQRSTGAAADDGDGDGDGEDRPYWRRGPQMDITPLLMEDKSGPKARRGLGVGGVTIAPPDHAIVDPNPPPEDDSLAVPPPVELMHPAGNVVVNRRIETAMLHNEVSVAQKIGNDEAKLVALSEDALFQQACAAVGFPPETLLPQPRARFKMNPETGRSRKKEEIDQLVAKADIDRIKKLALVLTDFRVLLAEAEKTRRREEKEARLAAIAAAQRALEERHDSMSVPSMPESLMSWTSERAGPSRPGTGNKAARPGRPEDKYPAELLARYGFDALELYGLRALEVYGPVPCERYGVAALDRFGVELLDRYGKELLELHGIEACHKFGAEALRAYPRRLLDQYGVGICERYPTDLLLLYSPDVLDVWPHALLREFPLDLLVKHPIDLLRKHPVDVLDKYPAEVLRKYALPVVEKYGGKALLHFPPDVVEREGREVCEEAVDVGLDPEVVGRYRAEKSARMRRIQDAELGIQAIEKGRASAHDFVQRASSPERPEQERASVLAAAAAMATAETTAAAAAAAVEAGLDRALHPPEEEEAGGRRRRGGAAEGGKR